MISLDDFKKSLGKSAEQLTETEILKLRELQDRMLEILFALWKENDNNKRQ